MGAARLASRPAPAAVWALAARARADREWADHEYAERGDEGLNTSTDTPSGLAEPGGTAARPPRWEHFPHGADIGVRGEGDTLAEALAMAALAMTAAITDPERVAPRDVARHEPAAEVKGATYTALAVEHRPDGRWLAQCVVDV